jgi:hypothetical protein
LFVDTCAKKAEITRRMIQHMPPRVNTSDDDDEDEDDDEDGGDDEQYPNIYGPIPVELVLSTKPAVMVAGLLHHL